MWKVLIILVVLGTVWSRTLDSTVKDVTTRTRPRGREDNTESDPSVQCTDCNEKIQTDGKVVDEKIFKPAIQVQGRNKVDKDTSKKRNGHHRRNRNKRKRERNVKRTRKPYISIGGVKIRINDQPTNSGRNVTIPNNKYDSLKIDQHIMGGSENRFTNDEDVNIETKSEDDINIASNKPVINEATKKNKMSNKKRHNRKDVIDNSTMGISVNTTKIGIEDSAKTNGGRDINQNPSISIHHEVGMFKDSVHAESEDKSGVRATKEGKDEAHILLSDEVKANSYSNEIKTKKRKHSKPQSTRIPKSGRKTGIESVKGSDNKHSQKSTVTKNNLNHQKEVSRKNDSKNDTKSTVWTEKTSIKQDEIRRKEALHSERKDNMLKTDGSKNVSQGSTDVETYSNDKNNKKHSDKVNPGKYRRLQSRRNSRRQRKGKHAKKKESVITSAAINDDRWSRPGLIQVPDVKRLERRLHPTVEAPVSDIITSFRKILHQMQHSIYLSVRSKRQDIVMEPTYDQFGVLTKVRGKFGYGRSVSLTRWSGEIYLHINDDSKCWVNGKSDKTLAKSLSMKWTDALALRQLLVDLDSYANHFESDQYLKPSLNETEPDGRINHKLVVNEEPTNTVSYHNKGNPGQEYGLRRIQTNYRHYSS